MGKGDTPRPYNTKKWDAGWLRAFGVKCLTCKGTGLVDDIKHSVEFGIDIDRDCPRCQGFGYVERKKK